MGTIQDKLNYLSTTKGLIKQAIIDKGQSVADTDTFRSYVDKISAISGGNLNIFVQQTEPETKKGIWLKRDSVDISGVVESNNVLLEGEWQPDGMYAPVPFTCDYIKAAVVGDDIYLFRGSGSPTKALKFNITNNSYTELTDIPVSLTRGAAVAIGTDIFLLFANYCYKYDTLTDTYTQLSSPPISYKSYSGNAVAIGSNIYYLLGKELYKYDTLTDTYTYLIEMSISTSNSPSFFLVACRN